MFPRTYRSVPPAPPVSAKISLAQTPHLKSTTNCLTVVVVVVVVVAVVAVVVLVVVVVVVVVVIVVVVVVVVLTSTRTIKSVITGQVPVTLELRNTRVKKKIQPKVVHAYITADTSCLYQKHINVKSGVSLRCARSMPVHTYHYSRLEKQTIPIATQGTLPRMYHTWYLSLGKRTAGVSQLEKRNK